MLLVGLPLFFGGMVFAIIQFAPCAFASSEAPFTSVVASVERWLEVEPPFPDTPDPDGTVVLEVSVREVEPGGDVGAASKERVAVHGSFVGDIQDALDDGSNVFLAMSSEGLDREQVAFVVARTTGGRHSFLGGCDWASGAAGLREGLGGRYEATMRRIVGLTDQDAIYRVLADVGDPGDRVLVEYDERPPDLRTFTRTGTLVERGRCLAIETDAGPLVPIWPSVQYFLAIDEQGLVVMSGPDRAFRPGDRLEFGGREMSPTEALAVTEGASIRACPGRLILVGSVSGILVP